VEDVVTTGGSAMEVVAVCEEAGAKVVGLAALVDRSAGLPESERPPIAPVALLTVQPRTWEPGECPACAAGEAVDSPGSRR
jgi:orotate phosphoribosyltransferase